MKFILSFTYLFFKRISEHLPKSASESSLSDACETTSAKESARIHEEKDICSDNDDAQYAEQSVEVYEKQFNNEKCQDSAAGKSLQKQGAVVLRRKSKCNPLYRKSKLLCSDI